MSHTTLEVLLVAGSAECPSRTRATLAVVADLLQEMGVAHHLWDLATDPLPLFDPRYYPNPHTNTSASVRLFAQYADRADAFVLASPVYHNSFSGVLKNALDSLSIAQFRAKPIALISCGNNDRTGSQPCDQLRIVARGLLAVAIPAQLVTLPTDFTFAQEQYHLVNDVIHQRVVHLVDELVSYASLMRPLHLKQHIIPMREGVVHG
jgi:azobenzene reductase